MESYLLKKAVADDKPVLGICRGIQLINACLGRILYQDLPTRHVSHIVHHQKPPCDMPEPDVIIMKGTPLSMCLNVTHRSVNSYHHQAVKELSEDLSAMAVSEDDIIEAVYREQSRFLWAVQWHPEFSYRNDKASLSVFRAFIEAIMEA